MPPGAGTGGAFLIFGITPYVTRRPVPRCPDSHGCVAVAGEVAPGEAAGGAPEPWARRAGVTAAGHQAPGLHAPLGTAPSARDALGIPALA